MTITLITGTSSGIGMSTALHLAGRGHKVYATVQSLDLREALVEEARRRGVSIELLALDVDRDESVQVAVSSVLKSEGRIDVCINNAGVALLGSIERSVQAALKVGTTFSVCTIRADGRPAESCG